MPAVATAGGLPTRLGKYEVLTPLAAGGMARIYIGRTTGIGSFERHVVLKLITPERANDTTAVQMFLDEARLAASLNHQNVAQVFEVGEDQGIHYLAMEYVHGQDLRALLAKAGSAGTRVPLELALTVVAGAAAGLHHAHERRGPDGVSLGIVHRDVSPSNIMIGYDGAVKLLDFGIAKATARSVETQSGIIKGKFAYMAPEQCRGREVDRRSDVFSLGIILYEISTQHRCFRADSDFDTMHRIVTGDVVRPTRLIPSYPQALETIVMKALAVDPNQRYQSAHQLLETLEGFAVSARMSLSTMALGRFMRETFGDQPEPWLNQHRASEQQLPVPRESTISNTNGTGSDQAIHHVPANLAQPPQPQPPSEAEPMKAAATLLDLPRAPDEARPEDHAGDWNASAKSYPAPQPTYASAATLPPEAPVRTTPPPAGLSAAPLSPAALPLAASSGVPANQFPAAPGSGSGPAHRAGFAANDLSYPRYEAPPGSADDVAQLKPNRRVLFIGLGVGVVGLAVILAMTIGSSGDAVKAPSEGAEQGKREPAPHAAVVPTADAAGLEPPEAAVEESAISIKITSDPAGADVLLFGKVIGTTPLDRQLEKGAGPAMIVIHKGGYVDAETQADLTADFETTVTLEKVAPPPIAEVKDVPKEPSKPPPVRPPPPKKEPPKLTPKPGSATPPKDPKGAGAPAPKDPPAPKEPKEPKEPKKELKGCQPQGQYDPFNDPRPVCK